METFKELITAYTQRVRSPIFGSIILAFILINWQPIFYVIFADNSVRARFEYWDQNMVWWRYSLPVLVGILFGLFSPKISLWTSKIIAKDINARRSLEVEQASKITELKETLLNERNARIEQEITRAEQEQRVKNIQDADVRKELEKKIENIEDEVSSSESDQDAEPNQGANEDDLNAANDSNDSEEFSSTDQKSQEELRDSWLKDEVAMIELRRRYRSIFEKLVNDGEADVLREINSLRRFEQSFDPFGQSARIDDSLSVVNKLNDRIAALQSSDNYELAQSMDKELKKKIQKVTEIYVKLAETNLIDDEATFPWEIIFPWEAEQD